MNHPPDHIIIEKTLGGDVNAFAILVDRYKQLVFTLTIRMIKQREEAEEIAQDVFLKAFQKLQSFKGDSKFSTWLYRITYNACLDALSRKRNSPTHHAYEIHDNVLSITTPEIEAQIDAQYERAEVVQCIALLPQADAFLITLYYLHEQSLEEIAQIIGLTKNNTKVKLFRIRKKLFIIMQSRLPQEIKMRYEKWARASLGQMECQAH